MRKKEREERRKEKKGLKRERGLRGTRRLKMGLNSVERMLRNVVQRMKSENYN